MFLLPGIRVSETLTPTPHKHLVLESAFYDSDTF